MYRDKPAPSYAYVGLCVAAAVFVMGLAVHSTVMIAREHQLAWVLRVALMVLILWPISLALCAYLVWIARSAYRVEYVVSDGAVELHYGNFHETIQTQDIVSIRRIWFALRRKLGGGSYCNRLTDVLLLRTVAGKNLYVSPADMERFCAELGIKAAV